MRRVAKGQAGHAVGMDRGTLQDMGETGLDAAVVVRPKAACRRRSRMCRSGGMSGRRAHGCATRTTRT
jgi:hypothetical protein